MRKFLVFMLLLAAPLAAQISAPQINLTGNIGCQGFPCVNTGTINLPTDANHTMTALESSAFYIKITSTVPLTTTRNLISPSGRFPFTIENATSGGQSIQIIGPSGTGVLIPNGQTYAVWNDGTNYVQIGTGFSYPGAGIPNSTGSSWGASYGTTGSGNVVLAGSNATTVNGQSCALGSSCTVTAAANAVTVGTTLVNSGTSGYILYNNGGVLGNLPTSGTGGVVLETSPSLTGQLSISGTSPSQVSALLYNITPATSGANQSSTQFQLSGQYWNGAASAGDTWVLQDVLGTGANPTSALTFSHPGGSSGATSVSIPNAALTGTPIAPTAPLNTNTTQIATTAYTAQEVTQASYCGTTTTCSNTIVPAPFRQIWGAVTLAAGTATVTGFSPGFNSTTTAQCNCEDTTAPLQACSASLASTTSVTVTGNATDTTKWHCWGN